MTWFVRATGHDLVPKSGICRTFFETRWATNGRSDLGEASTQTTDLPDLQEKSLNGSDGASTRERHRIEIRA
jgi:hypothetical protein